MNDDESWVVLDNQWYPKSTWFDRWEIRQRWMCWFGIHFVLPAEPTAGKWWPKCICGRCGVSGYWGYWAGGDVSELHINHGHWKQAGLAVPEWRRKA